MSEQYYIVKGPIIIVPDPINSNFYQVKKNPEWSQIPEICSFSDFICWNYQEDYERVMRHCIENGLVPYGEYIGSSQVYIQMKVSVRPTPNTVTVSIRWCRMHWRER